jgi:hypothetical protein
MTARRFLLVAAMVCACAGSSKEQVPQPAQPPPPPPKQPAAQPAPAAAPAAPPAQAAPPSTQGGFAPEALEAIVSPIALFPDPLLGQVLEASLRPQEVAEASAFLKAHPSLAGKELEAALKDKPWDQSVKALAALPDVLKMLSEHQDWARDLGTAYRTQRESVLFAVQQMRSRAMEAGNLKSSSQQTVRVEKGGTASDGTATTIIYIEPAQPQVVYVPVYSPTVVYGTWAYPAYPPPPVYPPGYVVGARRSASPSGSPSARATGAIRRIHRTRRVLRIRHVRRRPVAGDAARGVGGPGGPGVRRPRRPRRARWHRESRWPWRPGRSWGPGAPEVGPEPRARFPPVQAQPEVGPRAQSTLPAGPGAEPEHPGPRLESPRHRLGPAAVVTGAGARPRPSPRRPDRRGAAG